MSILALDVRTILVLLVIGNLAAGALLLAYRTPVSAKRPVRRYVTGAFVQAIAWALLAMRGQIPDSLSVYAGNILLFISFGLECLAFSTVDGPSRRLEVLFAAIVLASTLSFVPVASNPNLRVVVASLVNILPYGCLAVLFLRPSSKGSLRLFVGVAVALFCPILAFRAVVALGRGRGFTLMTPDLAQTLTFLVMFFFAFIGAIAFILLLKERSDSLLAESEEKYRSLVERASEAIVIAQDERLDFANPKAALMVGRREGELEGRPFADFVWPEDVGLVRERFQDRVEGGQGSEIYDFRLRHSDGTPRWVSLSSAVIRWKGRPATLTLLTDIDARKKAEDRVLHLLAEKELLLREVHHRIKNNLTVAMSLLSLQADESGGRDSAAVLLDARGRLQVLAELYDLLHRSSRFDAMAVRDFLGPLLERISELFPRSPAVRLELEGGEFELDSGRLTTLGIIVNEVVTNSMKHAFAAVEKPLVRVRAGLEDGRIIISLSDNGSGLPSGFQPGSSGGLGTQLIEMLAGQLKAELRVEGSPGTRYVIEFDAALAD